MKLLVATGSGWSLVYTLNNRGDSTEPCVRPFRWFRHLLCLPFSSTLNRRFDSIVLVNFVSGTSSVSNNEFNKEPPVVDGIVGCSEVNESSTGDLVKLKTILNVLDEV